VGCEVLWQYTTGIGVKRPLARFALRYLRHHHNAIYLKVMDRPVDAGAEIPADFLTFARIEPLFYEKRQTLRKYALELAHFEFRRWQPNTEALVRLCQSQYVDVKEFVANALLVEDKPEHSGYRLGADQLALATVYHFCESDDLLTRRLGMQLIEKNLRLQQADALFRLTESAYRPVRIFAAKQLWHIQQQQTIPSHWTVYEKNKMKPKSYRQNAPLNLIDSSHLATFLRYILFTLPPARLAKEKQQSEVIPAGKLLPHYQAKIALINIFRDLALQDGKLAKALFPLLSEFMHSRGKAEQSACLVAVTRLRYAYPELSREYADD
jgi:hypothetical protein